MSSAQLTLELTTQLIIGKLIIGTKNVLEEWKGARTHARAHARI